MGHSLIPSAWCCNTSPTPTRCSVMSRSRWREYRGRGQESDFSFVIPVYGQMDLGFRDALLQFKEDNAFKAAFPKAWNVLVDLLTTKASPGSLSFSTPNSVSKCSGMVSQFMAPWKGVLQGWLKAHPGQPPPAALTTPPILPSCSI